MRKRTLVLLLSTLTAVGGCIASRTAPGPILQGSGTIQYTSLEGGFYLIVSDAGRKFDPLRLDPAVQRDGLRVRYVVRPRSNAVSVHMVGTIVDVIQIEPIEAK